MITVSGTPHEIGLQLGQYFAERIISDCETARQEPPKPPHWPDHLDKALQYLQHYLPEVWAETVGIAEGAQVSVRDFVLSSYEDLWDLDGLADTGCTDIQADATATANGRVLLGHNNDESLESPDPVLIRIVPNHGAIVTGVGLGGPGFAVGVNSLGLVLSGNQLKGRDVRAGIPRIFLLRAALSAPTIEKAAEILMHPKRSSSYNNVLADRQGRILNLEGSAKSYAPIPLTGGVGAHSNHYRHPKMLPVEIGDKLESSKWRLARAQELLRHGPHSLETFAAILRDHRNQPLSICRHDPEGDVETGFSILFEPEIQRFWFAPGCPCKHGYHPVRY